MIWNRVMIFLIFCTLKSKFHQTDALQDIDYYYLDTMGTQPTDIIPQDGQDAQTIIDSKLNPEVIAKIFLSRDKIRRMNINKEITKKDKDHPLVVPEKYESQKDPTTDLYFILTHDEKTVMAEYLHEFFWCTGPEPWITIAFTLTKDMIAMRKTYDKMYGGGRFKTGRKTDIIGDAYEHMLRVWVRQNREPNEKEELKPDVLQKDVDALIDEYSKGCWYEHRDQIELILMKKSIKYAREVIKVFEKAFENCPMEQIIDDSIHRQGLDADIAKAYSTLTRYIKNRNQCIADLMREHSDGADCWAVWMLCIAVTYPEEWIEIDKCFRNSGDKEVSLSQFITEKNKIPDQRSLVSLLSQILDVTTKDSVKSSINSPVPVPPSGPPPAS